MPSVILRTFRAAAPSLCLLACLLAPPSAPAAELSAAGTLEVAFSPDGSAQALVLKVIDSARKELRVLAYNFTSSSVTRALIRARKRGVDVRLVVDHRLNVEEDRTGKSRAALSALAHAGVEVRTTEAFLAHHDKVIVADRETVELGSYNFTEAAARRNSENVLVNWRNPALARAYLAHFERNRAGSLPYVPRSAE